MGKCTLQKYRLILPVSLFKSFHKWWHPAKLNWGRQLKGKGMFQGVGKIVLGTDDSR